MLKRIYLVLFTMILALLGIISVQAQEQTILVLVVPDFWQNLVEDSETLVGDFETQFGVDVQIEYSNNGLGAGPSNPEAVADYSEDLVNYLKLGDVVYAEGNWLTPEVTRPGFVVDLMPLINADMNLNPNDFYPAVWQSFQWDGGMWAMPTSADALFVDYVPEAFDEAGIAYPSINWTIDDFDDAVRELTQYDDDNEIELPGAQVSNEARAALFYAFLGRGFYDSAAFPDSPSFATVDMVKVIDIWSELLNDGVLVTGGGGFGGGLNDIPIRIGSGGQFSFSINPDEENTDTDSGFNFEDDSAERALVALPNGFVVLQTNGFAISSGTQNLPMAYELVRYLSERQTVANADVASEPARTVYFNEAQLDELFTINIERSPEDEALIQDALYNGIPSSELRYSRYIGTAINLVRAGLDGITALHEAEVDAVSTLEEMANLDVNFTVETPDILTVSENEIVLTFEMLGFGPGGLPNQEEWDRVAADFAAQDPEVGAVSVEQMGARQLMFGSFECAYYPSTLIVSIDPEKMLALDPLLFSDMNYNINELPAGVLDLMQLNGFTYGIPLTVQPLMLNYNPEMFQQAGVPEPIGGWTISEFANALELLQFIVQEDSPSFSPQGNTTAAVLMLIFAEGGNPIDLTTDPPTLDFTSPESIAAAEIVLGWAKDGLIEYGGSGGFGGGGGPGGGGFGTNEVVPIGATFFGGFGLSEENRLTTYPTGINTPVAFDVGAGYINKDMANPEACYRWMSYLARHSYVFTGSMPALVSQLYDPVVSASIGDEAVAAYQQIADMLNDPSVLSLTTGDPFIVTWLSRAFDNYVLEDADLLTELELADQYTRDYLVCAADLDDDPTLFGLLDLQGCVEEVDSAAAQ